MRVFSQGREKEKKKKKQSLNLIWETGSMSEVDNSCSEPSGVQFSLDLGWLE